MRKNIDIPSMASQNQSVILTAKTIKEMLLMCFPLLYNGGIYVWFDVTVVCALWCARKKTNTVTFTLFNFLLQEPVTDLSYSVHFVQDH